MRKIIKDNTYNGNALSETWKNSEGYYEEILMALKSLFESMINRNSRIYFSMYTLRFPAGSVSSYPSDNSLISKFVEALMRQYRNMGCDAQYIWARENSSTGQFHYHLVLLVDGNKVQNAHLILKAATKIWQRCLDIDNAKGLINVSKIDEFEPGSNKNGIKINKNDPLFPSVYGTCYQYASYLAKCYSKGPLLPYVNGFGHSRLN
jgi:hypothetical protein